MAENIKTLPKAADFSPQNVAAGVAAAPKTRKKKDQPLSREHQALVDEYYATLARLKSLEDFFQRTTDSELISACIYEMNAAQQQFAYTLQRLKREGVRYLKVLR